MRGPKCFRCSRIGHVVKNCPLNKRNSVNIAENSERSESQGFESEDVALSSSTNDCKSEWFIDSAATKHMTYSRSILTLRAPRVLVPTPSTKGGGSKRTPPVSQEREMLQT